MANFKPRCIVNTCIKSAGDAQLVIAPDEIIVRYSTNPTMHNGEQMIGPLCQPHADELAVDVLDGGDRLHRWRIEQVLGKPDRLHRWRIEQVLGKPDRVQLRVVLP